MNRPCIDCRRPTPRTRCPECQRRWDRERQARRPGYGGEYQANRAIVLAGDPPCYVIGCTTPATTADHIRPLRDGGTHDLWNLRPSCVKHNSGRRD